jgi:hypothetical protein
MKKSFIAFLLLPLLCFAENLVKNGDFSIKNEQGDFPACWEKVNAGKTDYADASLIFHPGAERIRVENYIPLKTGRKYRLTLEAKAEDFSGQAGVYLTTLRWQGGLSLPAKAGTYDWSRMTGEISFDEPQEPRYRLILFAREKGKGKIHFRNISVVEMIDSASAAPFITAGTVAAPPAIDGVLDDDAWKGLPELTPFMKRGKYQFTEFALEQTRVKIGYDHQNLYVAFRNHQRCLDPARNTLDRFKADVRTHDSDLLKQDCNMVFISPDGGAERFYEIIINGAGTVTDALCQGPDYWTTGRNPRWESRTMTAVRVGDGKWDLEAAIPWESLDIKPSAGLEFTICLGRLNQDSNEGTTYFEMPRAFHVPEYFGKIRLGGPLPGWNSLQIGELKNGENTLTYQAPSAAFQASAAVSDDQKPVQTFTSPSSPLAYRLDANRFATVQFNFSDAKQPFLVSPAYRVNCVKRTIFTDKAQIELDGRPVNAGHFEASDGYYTVKGLTAPFEIATGVPENKIRFEQTPSALLINQSTLWPENDRKLYIAENSIQPLFLAAHHSNPVLNSLPYAFTLALPEEIGFAGASDFVRSGRQFQNLKTAEAGIRTIGGQTFRLFRVEIPGGLTEKPYYQNNDGIAILLKLGVSGQAFTIRDSRIFYWAEYGGGKVLEAPEKLDVVIYPPLRGMTPRRYITQMWGGVMVNLNRTELISAYIRETLVPVGINDLQNVWNLSKGTGMTHFCVINFLAFWGADARKFAEANSPARRIDHAGKQIGLDDYNPICPQVFLDNSEFQQIMEKGFRRYCQNYQYLNFDYESPAATGRISCYCPRCLSKFRETANIPAAQTIKPETVFQEYRSEWIAFSNRNLAEITAVFRKIVNGQGRKLTFYSGYQSERTREQYNVDWKLLAPHIDYAECGYQTPAETYLNTVKALGSTPLLTGVISGPWHFTSREMLYPIDKAFTIKGIVLGSKGFLCFNAPQLDGRSYHSMSEAAALLAKYEHIMYDGRIDHSAIRMNGAPNENWALFVHPGQSEQILIIYNDAPEHELKYMAELPAAMPVFTVVDEAPLGVLARIQGSVKPGDYHAFVLKP